MLLRKAGQLGSAVLNDPSASPCSQQWMCHELTRDPPQPYN